MSIVVAGTTYTGITVGGVECLELVADMVEGVDDRGPYATKKYLCTWGNRYALANNFLGFTTHTGGQNGSIQITGPYQFPESPNMLARSVRIEGRGRPSQGLKQIEYPFAVIAVDFAVPPWQAIPYPDTSIDPTTPFVYATQDIRFTREMLTVPNAALYLAGTTERLDDIPYAVAVPNAIFNINIHKVPFLPAFAVWTAMAKPLNLTTFLGIPAGYLRFDGADNHGEASSDGTFAQSLAFQFTARALLRWDEKFDKSGTPRQVRLLSALGTPLLQRSEFRTLIPSNYYG